MYDVFFLSFTSQPRFLLALLFFYGRATRMMSSQEVEGERFNRALARGLRMRVV